MTIAIAAILMLLATFAFCLAAYQRNRANNLALQVDGLRDEIVELVCRADDAQREADRYRASNAHLIREATTLAIDLARTETEAASYRAFFAFRMAATAGLVITRGLDMQNATMAVGSWEKERP